MYNNLGVRLLSISKLGVSVTSKVLEAHHLCSNKVSVAFPHHKRGKASVAHLHNLSKVLVLLLRSSCRSLEILRNSSYKALAALPCPNNNKDLVALSCLNNRGEDLVDFPRSKPVEVFLLHSL